MTETEIKLIKKSWKLLKGVDPVLVGELFYTKLFKETPSLRRKFPNDMTSQNIKFVEMLNFIVFYIDKTDELSKKIAVIAESHHRYDTKPAHYQKVGEALLWTLKKGLGVDWTEATANAWLAYYTLLSNRMMEGY